MSQSVELDVKRAEPHTDSVFAPLDRDNNLERIGGGFETEVYCTDDHRYVVKLKSDLGGDLSAALACARRLRATAEEFAGCLGPQHSIPSHYVLARDSAGRVQALVVQPFIRHARPLYKVDYRALSDDERTRVAAQLTEIVWSALAFYHETGYMPDLYGIASTSNEERLRLRSPHMLPWHLWSFLAERNLLRSHNLLLTNPPECRIVLVDYDLVPWPWLVRLVYFAVRWLLCWRDHLLIIRMRRGNRVPEPTEAPDEARG